MVALVAAVVVVVLAISSTGSAVVPAVLLGLAMRDARAGVAAGLAVLATAIRFGTADLADLAGLQSVLGPAVAIGPEAGAAASALAAVAVVIATRRGTVVVGVPGRAVHLPALAAGALAATLVAGPGTADLAVRVGATVLATALAVGASALPARLDRGRALLSVVAGAAAVALALAA